MNDDSDWKIHLGGLLSIVLGSLVLGFTVGWMVAFAIFMICLGLLLVITDYVRFVTIRAVTFINKENNS